MTRSVSIADLKSHLSQLVGEVQFAGGRLIIEKHGKPVAMLVPIEGARAEGLLGLLGAFDDAPGFAEVLDEVVASRKADRPRKVPRLR